MEIAETLVCHYDVPNSEIAVLTPYSAQKEVISEKLKQRQAQQRTQKRRRSLDDKLLRIKTITESQGEV